MELSEGNHPARERKLSLPIDEMYSYKGRGVPLLAVRWKNSEAQVAPFWLAKFLIT
jgi:hypothetical protein